MCLGLLLLILVAMPFFMGDLVIKARKKADLRMRKPEVVMTFFIGREDPIKEEAENMAGSNSAPPPLPNEEIVMIIQQQENIHSFLEGIGLRSLARREAAQALLSLLVPLQATH